MVLSSPRSTARTFRIPPPAFYGDIDRITNEAANGNFSALRDMLWQFVEWQRITAEVVALLMDGKNNATGTVTLTASVATTTLLDRRIGAQTKIILAPTTANAAAEMGAGTLYLDFPNVTEGNTIINHANNAQTDRDYIYILVG